MTDFGFWLMAENDPGYLALVTPEGEELRGGELLGRANQLVHALRNLGLEKGDTIAFVLPNCAEVFEIYLAALQAGWYIVPINHHLVAPEIAYIVRDSEAKIFVGHSRYADACIAAVEEAGVPLDHCLTVGEGRIEGFRSYVDLRCVESTDRPENRFLGDTMNYTSGTTGNPKGVRRALPDADPDAMAISLAGILLLFGIQSRDGNVHIVGSPLYHTAVLRFSGASMHMGHTVVLMDKWGAEDMLRLIERYHVTHSHMVPTQFHRLLALPDDVRNNYDLSSLRHMIHAAAPCPVDTKHKMIDWWGPVIDEYYAASEGGGTIVNTEEWLKKPGTVGRPWPISEIAIFDDGEDRLPAGQIGTVYMSMQTGDFEYHKDKEKTKKNRIGKFFTVGDVGYLDEDGYLFLCDRKTDMIISGGANIYPAEIENVLLAHPVVVDAAVFGIPHDDWGEEVKAVIQPVDGVEGTPELAAEILEWCEPRLAKFKTPKSIDFTDDMPRDPNGKLYKRKLRDPYWEGRARAI
ncbi:MAG: acyl-CoA synthetase [Acidimicrobiales bacterium]